jgi:hypothetical protein
VFNSLRQPDYEEREQEGINGERTRAPAWRANQGSLDLGLMEEVLIESRDEDWRRRGVRSQGIDLELTEPVRIRATST